MEDNILILAQQLLNQNIFIAMKMEDRNVTFSDVNNIINEGSCEGVDSLDRLSIIDNNDAWKYLIENIDKPFQYEIMLKFNEITARNEALIPGAIRTGNVSIGGVGYKPAIPNEKEVKIRFKEIQQIKDPIERGLEYFCWISRNQLFWDGNKRTSYLAANKELIKNNIGVLCIDTNKINEFVKELAEYYESGGSDNLKRFLRSQIKTV